ncbi:MAG: GNAT family N-acetyltransferase [Jatrophihabitans sp.]|uniref:GNAT family N-acetyltransferase n=1 Tax=Jatrophihabitans sp. TaxID=1932789 RepID=UPI003F7FCD01
MDLEILNPLPESEIGDWSRALAMTLLFDSGENDLAPLEERWRSRWTPERAYAVRDRGRVVATLLTDARTMTVPGPGGGTVALPVDALTGVSVAATHHRRGLLTRMLTSSLAAAKDRGDPCSVLVAAEWPIYGRFGYGPAVRYADYVYRPRGRGAHVAACGRGTVRQVEPAELLEVAPALFERARRRRAGQISRTDAWWGGFLGVTMARIGPRKHWLLREGADGPDGLLGWRTTRDFELDGAYASIEVESFVAAGGDAERDHWNYHPERAVIEEVHLGMRSVDEPARFLMADGRALRQTFTGDFAWVRLLDVPAALSARGWAGSDRLVLEVVDDHPGAPAAGRFALDATPDGAACTPTTASADLTLSVRALGAVYLGGHSLAVVAAGGEVDEHTAGAVRRLDALLATALAPWCQTGF